MSTLLVLALLGLTPPTPGAPPRVTVASADGGEDKKKPKKKKDRDEKTEEELAFTSPSASPPRRPG